MNMRKIKELVEAYGVDTILFKINSQILKRYGNQPDSWEICYISEEKYPVSNDYKITLVPFNNLFWPENYYLSDLESLIQQGYGYIYIKEEL